MGKEMAFRTGGQEPDSGEVAPLLTNSHGDNQSFGSISSATTTPVEAGFDERGLAIAKGHDSDDQASLEEGETESGPALGGGNRNAVKIISVLLLGMLYVPFRNGQHLC